MWGYVVLLIGLTSALNTTTTTYDCTEESYLEHCFTSCLGDQLCSLNLNLHSDDQVYFQYLIETELVRPMHLSWSDVCSGHSMFLALMRTHEFCKPNHIVDMDNGCICRNDKRCDEKPPSAFRLSELTKIVLLIIIVILAIYVGLGMLKELKKETRPKKQQQPVERNLDNIRLDVS